MKHLLRIIPFIVLLLSSSLAFASEPNAHPTTSAVEASTSLAQTQNAATRTPLARALLVGTASGVGGLISMVGGLLSAKIVEAAFFLLLPDLFGKDGSEIGKTALLGVAGLAIYLSATPLVALSAHRLLGQSAVIIAYAGMTIGTLLGAAALGIARHSDSPLFAEEKSSYIFGGVVTIASSATLTAVGLLTAERKPSE